jgi:hypothetical protein
MVHRLRGKHTASHGSPAVAATVVVAWDLDATASTTDHFVASVEFRCKRLVALIRPVGHQPALAVPVNRATVCNQCTLS